MRIILIILSLLCLLSNCSSNRSADYEVIDGVMRSELVQLSLYEQQKILADVSPEIKTRLWLEKYNDTMQSHKLTDEERDIIRPWKTFITDESFQKAADGLDDTDFDAFTEKLESELMGRLGWDENKFYEYLCTVMTEAEWEETSR